MSSVHPVREEDRDGRRASFAEPLVRILCLAVAIASAAGLMFAFSGANSASADAALTIKWTGDTSSASAYQPTRSTSSPHYSSLDNLSVSVSQTTQLSDQAISVTVSGFDGPTESATDFAGTVYSSAMNFVQAMECWGDPSSATFYQTCEWGGHFGANGGIGTTVYSDTVTRVPSEDLAPHDAIWPTDPLDVPFEAADGTVVSGHQTYVPDANGNDTTATTYPIFGYYNSTTSDEVTSGRIDSDGTGSFDFQVQDANDAPQMGCGTPGHLRCYLVIVPRDTIYGGHDSSCSDILDNHFNPYTYGRANSIQAGSPVNPNCDYWNNRMVVPLDFNAIPSTCTQGQTEESVIGSELMVSAMSSWQPQLCSDLNKTFSFVQNPDDVARSQLVEQQAGLAFSSQPITAAALSTEDQSAFESSTFSYAPVAVTGGVFSYYADGPDGRITSLNLTPRLVAKLLTQSYTFTVPYNSSDPVDNFEHLPAVNRSYVYLADDPDFQAANPTNWQDFIGNNPQLVVPGPFDADVINELWQWIDGDSDARSFLQGNPDPWGMTVNPYYLPKGNPNAQVPTFNKDGTKALDADGNQIYAPVGLSNLDGTPLDLSTSPPSDFLKADASIVPLDQSQTRYGFSSSQFSPYSDDFVTAADDAFLANNGAKTTWDPTQLDSSGDQGAWVSGGAEVAGHRFVIGFTDAASSINYDLSNAALEPDNLAGTFVEPTNTTMTASLADTAVLSSNPAVEVVDPTKASGSDYPLTAIVYADVNLTSLTTATQTDFSNFINEVTTTGQVPGVEVGQLPPGYVPLSSALAAQASAAATAIKTYTVPTSGNTDGGGDGVDTSGGGSSTGDSGDASGAGATSTGGGATISTPKPTVTRGKTPASSVSPIAQGSLIGSLAVGLSGSLFAPLLFRRRRRLP